MKEGKLKGRPAPDSTEAIAPRQEVELTPAGKVGKHTVAVGAVLTRRECEIVQLVSEGLRDKEIAERLCAALNWRMMRGRT